ncbi:hypothetical protein AQI95_29105 [Streptomyces yokosukanensis]|uniref:Uncharacterized protein n=1 Tax=Streptomyces yokosukanensis TaxID=67386 RepID=A0A101NZJ4_9ACTN|nr:hypothetical protein AQI95_29105 [Streptomyces yokosukanensis]
MSDSTDDVVDVLTAQIEGHFGMSMDSLKAAVAAAPTVHLAATEIVSWHRLLVASQAVLERAEDELLTALQTQSAEVVDAPTMDLAHRVNAAVAARDGRAMAVRWLLDPNAPGKTGLAAERLARFSGTQRGPAVPAGAVPAAAPRAGRGVLR